MDARTRLLVVDDDPSIRGVLRDYLQKHGFDVAEAANGKQMRDELAREVPEAVLLDLRLPGEDGFALARHLREHYELALIMVTASGDLVDRVVGLELGADDYVAKPFDLRELLARLRSVLRRSQARPAAAPETRDAVSAARQPFGRCQVDVQAHRLFDPAGAEIPMTPMEFDLVEAFLANPNRVLTRDQLLLRTRNREAGPYDRAIDIRIGRLRRKVEPDPEEPRCIRTVRSAGYMFVPDGGSARR